MLGKTRIWIQPRFHAISHVVFAKCIKRFRRIKDTFACICDKFCDDLLVYSEVIGNFIFQPRFHSELYTSLFKPCV